jgi:hypothetical protein
MAGNDPVKRNIRFSVMDITYKGSPVNIRDVFGFIDALDFTSGDRYYETSEGINLAVFLDQSKLPIRGIIGDSRKKALPMVETNGNRKGLTLPNRSSGLFDGNHFIIFENKYKKNIIAHEFNFYAPRINRLAQYIMAKCQTMVDYCAIEPIQNQDIRSILKKIKFPNYFEIKAHRTCSFLSFDKSLNEAFKSMASVTDADCFGISFSCRRGRKNPIDMKNFGNIPSFMKTGDAQELLEKFHIQYRNMSTGQNENVDLTNLFLNDTAYVSQIDDMHRSVDSDSMYRAIDENITKHYTLLNGVQV